MPGMKTIILSSPPYPSRILPKSTSILIIARVLDTPLINIVDSQEN